MLEENCNKEIFLIYNEPATYSTVEYDKHQQFPVDVFSTTELMTAVDYLKRLSPNLDYETTILHGVLTKASTIPKNLRSKKAYIIIEDIYDQSQARVIEAGIQTDEELANKISLIVGNKNTISIPLQQRTYDVDVEIDDLYILYGYEIPIILSLDEELLDEQIIDSCQKIADDAKALKI